METNYTLGNLEQTLTTIRKEDKTANVLQKIVNSARKDYSQPESGETFEITDLRLTTTEMAFLVQLKRKLQDDVEEAKKLIKELLP